MDNSAQLLIAQRLLKEFLLVKANIHHGHDRSCVLKNSKLIEAKMIRLYYKCGKHPDILDILQKMDAIIKKLEKKQNNHVTDM